MADPAPPPGFVPIDQPPPGFVPISGQPQGWNAVAANALTGLQGGVGNLLGLPNTAAKLAGSASGALGLPRGPSDFRAQHTLSPDEINQGLYNASGWLTGTTPQPYADSGGSRPRIR